MRFKEFLKEESSKDIIEKWNEIYKSYGSHPLPNNFKLFNKIKSSIKGTSDNLCYSNSLENAKLNNDIDLAVGVIFEKDAIKRLLTTENYISFTYHAWNIENDKVIDCTLGSTKNEVYLGIIVPKNIVNKLKDGSDVRDYLFKILKI